MTTKQTNNTEPQDEVDGQRCPECGHEDNRVAGTCRAESRTCPGVQCGCKCDFPEAVIFTLKALKGYAAFFRFNGAAGLEAETVAKAITKAAQAIVDIAARDNMQVPHRGTLEMIIRDFAVNPLLTARVSSDAKQDYVRGLEDAAKAAYAYLSDERNGVKNNPRPNCVAHAIRALITTPPTPSDAKLREQDLNLLDEIYDFFDQTGDGAEDASYSNRMANQFSGRLKNLIDRLGA